METTGNKYLSKGYVCRKIRLYNFLIEKGFRPVQVRPDRECSNRLVWIFNDTVGLRALVEEYYDIRDKALRGGE